MTPYNHQEVEKKWQKRWQEQNASRTDLNSKKEKYYCLDMFPYPSGEGLHVGHWRGYVLSDVLSRLAKMEGKEVLHPMGWDAFGLPAENFAIKKGVHPQISTQKNIDRMREQLKKIGAIYDWDFEINSSHEEYYRWTQWIFAEFYKNGLAYRKKAPVNFCLQCQTVLANEQVIDNECERCGSEVEKRNISQWFFRITDFAEELLNDLDSLDWPEKVKKMQRNWIGKSIGTEFSMKIDGLDEEFSVFTTRVDTVFGMTYCVLSPEHNLVEKITSPKQQELVLNYKKEIAKLSEIDRTSESRERTGVFTGAFAVHPLTEEKIPIWIADYVLASYGTGAIMAVPAHDKRDFDFAQRHDIPIKTVIFPK